MNFSRKSEGELQVTFLDGSQYVPVSCVPLFPLSDPDSYIAIIHESLTGAKTQVGMISNIKDLQFNQQQLVKKEIKFRYFIPEIIEIYSIKPHNRRVDTWSVLTDRGEATFTVRNRQESMIWSANGSLLITDEQNRRYRIKNRSDLNKRSTQQLNRLI